MTRDAVISVAISGPRWVESADAGPCTRRASCVCCFCCRSRAKGWRCMTSLIPRAPVAAVRGCPLLQNPVSISGVFGVFVSFDHLPFDQCVDVWMWGGGLCAHARACDGCITCEHAQETLPGLVFAVAKQLSHVALQLCRQPGGENLTACSVPPTDFPRRL